MLIGELREALKEFPAEYPVLLSMDEEGNGFSHLTDVEQNICNKDLEEIYSGGEEDTPEGLINCVILWP